MRLRRVLYGRRAHHILPISPSQPSALIHMKVVEYFLGIRGLELLRFKIQREESNPNREWKHPMGGITCFT
jgi:hypothetical protein